MTRSDADARALAREVIADFVTVLAREMRTPLETVIGLAELMRDATAADIRDYAADLTVATDELRLRVLRTLVRFRNELERHRAEAGGGFDHQGPPPFEPLAAALARACGAVATGTSAMS